MMNKMMIFKVLKVIAQAPNSTDFILEPESVLCQHHGFW